ncbi:hypothetical protein Patl1_23198 [Pistacia atlantica]|uniref:Uncharacterized protein n=1 Tax=Pistacia atlantica TaxID=434234 RepID=A0ACC1A137_9ROSI|nr:hypothetical protein Patl1_23198 [Pistacia atlantica]
MVEERGIIPGTVLAFLESQLQVADNAPLPDICIGTSAAPFYLPPHHFEVNSSKGTKRFNLINGGIAAKKPVTLLAICEAAKEMSGNGNSPSLSMVDSSNFLFSLLELERQRGMSSLRLVMEENWDSLIDNSKKENLEHLEEIGKDLLKKPVSQVNLETGLHEPIENGGTYKEALIKFAKRLSEERRFRQQHSQTNLCMIYAFFFLFFTSNLRT